METTPTPVSGDGATTGNSTSSAPSSQNSLDLSKLTPEQIEQIAGNYKTKMKINGKERELSLAELKKHASIAQASEEKFTSAKKMREEAEQIRKAVESGDVVKSLKNMGKSPQEIKRMLEDNLLNMIEEENLDPKERELREYRERDRLNKEKEEENKKTQEKQKYEAEVKKHQQKLESDMIQAVQKSNLPVNAMVFKMIAQEMLSAGENDIEMTVEDAVSRVESQIIDTYLELLPKIGKDRVKNALGKDLLGSLRAEEIKSIKDASSNLPQAKKPVEKKETKSEERPVGMTQEQFFRQQRLKYAQK
jgi:hypothetical protein